MLHIPVLLSEVVDLLNLRAGARVVDATLGLGGHSEAILKAIAPGGKLLAFEQDEANLNVARERLKPFGKNAVLVHANFEELAAQAQEHGFAPADAILFDLGLSSPHVDEAERGFSFKKEGPLDMRFDRRQHMTAADVVNGLPERELADVIYRYGEETRSRQIAKKITEARRKNRFTTTLQLAELIGGKGYHKIHPATRTFQALRIYVNRELEVLESALDQAIALLKPGGRIVVISYHSLEDRLVKEKFRHYSRSCICPPELPICQCKTRKTLYLITKKPIIPSGIEVEANPRSRSAKLRVAQRL